MTQEQVFSNLWVEFVSEDGDFQLAHLWGAHLLNIKLAGPRSGTREWLAI